MVTMTADGKEVKLGGFASEILSATLRGMLSALKGGGAFTDALVRVEDDRTTLLAFDGKPAETNAFVSAFLARVVAGAAHALHGTESATRFEVHLT